MPDIDSRRRRHFLIRTLGATGALLLAGCNRLSQTEWFPKVLGLGESASEAALRLVATRASMAQEFTDADRSPTFFRFDPQEQFDLYKAMSAAGEEIVVVYHSHTSTEAYPSRTDIALASEPQAHYVLVSTAESGASDGLVSVRSYRIVDGSVTEEEIDVTE